jgi:hypothetical protein
MNGWRVAAWLRHSPPGRCGHRKLSAFLDVAPSLVRWTY